MRRKIVATIEARMSSTRLPGKVLLPAAGKPILEHLVERLLRVERLDGIVMATTVREVDNPIIRVARKLGIEYYRGSEEDVLGRVLGAARFSKGDVVVEITADCPLIDPSIVGRCIEEYFARGVDYVSNALQPSYPVGITAQVFATDLLEEVCCLTKDKADREHVSLYIYSHPEKYRLLNVLAPPEQTRPTLRLTLDTLEDYEVIRRIFDALYPIKREFDLSDILGFLDAHPEISAINARIQQKKARP